MGFPRGGVSHHHRCPEHIPEYFQILGATAKPREYSENVQRFFRKYPDNCNSEMLQISFRIITETDRMYSDYFQNIIFQILFRNSFQIILRLFSDCSQKWRAVIQNFFRYRRFNFRKYSDNILGANFLNPRKVSFMRASHARSNFEHV